MSGGGTKRKKIKRMSEGDRTQEGRQREMKRQKQRGTRRTERKIKEC